MRFASVGQPVLLALCLLLGSAAAAEPAQKCIDADNFFYRLEQSMASGDPALVLDELGFDQAIGVMDLIYEDGPLLLDSPLKAHAVETLGYQSRVFGNPIYYDEGSFIQLYNGRFVVWFHSTAGWLSDTTGLALDELERQFRELHTLHNGTLKRVGGERRKLGPVVFTADSEDVHFEMQTHRSHGSTPRNMRYEFYLHADAIEQLKIKFHGPLWPDPPSTEAIRIAGFGELLAAASEEGAQGILDLTDMSDFDYLCGDAKNYRSAKLPWTTHAEYYAMSDDWTETMRGHRGRYCRLDGYDEGCHFFFSFTGEWIDGLCDVGLAGINAGFDEFLHDNSGREIVIDSPNDRCDMQFSYFRAEDVLVSRKKYLHPAEDDARYRFALSRLRGDEERLNYDRGIRTFVGEIEPLTWPLETLSIPELSESAGAIERFIHLWVSSDMQYLQNRFDLVQGEDDGGWWEAVYQLPWTTDGTFKRKSGDWSWSMQFDCLDWTVPYEVTAERQILADDFGVTLEDIDREITSLQSEYPTATEELMLMHGFLNELNDQGLTEPRAFATNISYGDVQITSYIWPDNPQRQRTIKLSLTDEWWRRMGYSIPRAGSGPGPCRLNNQCYY